MNGPGVDAPAEGADFELRNTPGRGEGVFATRAFQRNDLVMRGVIVERLSGNHSHASQVGENQFVLHAGLIPKVNHSCNPNCGIAVNAEGAHDFIAFHAIAPGDELTADYAMRNYRVEHFPAQCFCGASNCRGRIDGWRSLSQDVKKTYEGFVAPYLLEIAEN